jgi:hypothetical protein
MKKELNKKSICFTCLPRISRAIIKEVVKECCSLVFLSTYTSCRKPLEKSSSLESLDTHRRVYELLRFNVNVCNKVDRVADFESSSIKEVDPLHGGERFWRNFRFPKSEF